MQQSAQQWGHQASHNLAFLSPALIQEFTESVHVPYEKEDGLDLPEQVRLFDSNGGQWQRGREFPRMPGQICLVLT